MLIRVSCPRCHITVWTDDPGFARSAGFHTKNCTQERRPTRAPRGEKTSRALETAPQPVTLVAAAAR